MSTKVYNAWRLPLGADIFAETAALHDPVARTQLSEDVAEIATSAVKIIDDFTFHADIERLVLVDDDTHADPTHPWSEAEYSLAYYESRRSQHLAGTNRQRFEIQFMKDDHDGRVYAIHYAENPKVIKTATSIMESRGWTDWHYQDQTDRDETIPQGEWNERRDVWDRLLGNRAPMDIGVGAVVRPEGKFGTTPNVVPLFDSGKKAIENARIPGRAARFEALAKPFFLSGISRDDMRDPVAVLDQWKETWEKMKASGQLRYFISQMNDIEVTDLRGFRKDPFVSHELTPDMLTQAFKTAGGSS